MSTFNETFGFIAALCLGIIILSLFFSALGYFKRLSRGYDIIKLKGLIHDGKLVNVHLSGGKSVTAVRLVGFTESTAKAHVPYQLAGMLVLEDASGRRTLVKAESVRMIQEVEGEAKPPS